MQLFTPGRLVAQRYQITRLLGSGGTSAVYEARDARRDCAVALKQNGLAHRRTAWLKAARRLVELKHPNLPEGEAVLDAPEGQFLILEYIAGPDLEEMLHGGAVPGTAEVLAWADQLLDALACLHQRRPALCHGAIRPRHLKLTGRGRPVLLDGRVLPADHLTTDASRAEPYTAPEACQRGQIDPRSDVYALAATLYHLLAGIPPVDAATRLAIVERCDPDPLADIDQVNTAVPPAVGAVLRAAMALDPRARPQTAAEFHMLLRRARDGQAPSLPESRARRWIWPRLLGS